MSYPPGQQPPTWGGQQPSAGWGPPPQVNYSPSPGGSGAGAVAIVAAFVGLLVLVVAIAAAVIFVNQPSAPTPPCQPGVPCAPGPSLPPVSATTPTPRPSAGSPVPTGAPSSGVPPTAPPAESPQPTPTSESPAVVLGGSTWRSASLGYGFEFDSGMFQLSQSTDELAVLDSQFFDAQVVIKATTDEVSPSEMIDQQVELIDGSMVGRIADRDDYDAVLGPSIGYVSGQSAVYSGILLSSDGTPAAPGGVTILASTDGRITVAVIIIVAEPDSRFGSDTFQFIVRTMADDILKTFDWGPPA